MTPELEFHEAMVELYLRAKREIKYQEYGFDVDEHLERMHGGRTVTDGAATNHDD
jgi:hypothetical protein